MAALPRAWQSSWTEGYRHLSGGELAASGDLMRENAVKRTIAGGGVSLGTMAPHCLPAVYRRLPPPFTLDQ
jgi:hypothetical protein